MSKVNSNILNCPNKDVCPMTVGYEGPYEGQRRIQHMSKSIMKIKYTMMLPDVVKDDYEMHMNIEAKLFHRPSITTMTEMKRLATKVRTVDHHDLSSVHLYTAKEMIGMINSKLIPSVEEFNPMKLFDEINPEELSDVEVEVVPVPKDEFAANRNICCSLDLGINEQNRLKKCRDFIIVSSCDSYVLNGGVKTVFPNEIFVISIGDASTIASSYFKESKKLAEGLGVKLDDDFTLGIPVARTIIQEQHFINVPCNNSFAFNVAVPTL